MEVFYDEKLNDYVYCVSEIIKAVAVEPLESYKLLVSFSTGEKKIYDVAPLLDKPTFLPLRDKNLFNTAYIAFGTVVWNDDIDISPENLYKNSTIVV